VRVGGGDGAGGEARGVVGGRRRGDGTVVPGTAHPASRIADGDVFEVAAPGCTTGMKWRRVISEEIRREGDGVNLRAAINTVVAANVDERNPRVTADDENTESETKEVQDE